MSTFPFFNTCLISPSPNNYPLLVESRTLLLELRLILTFIRLDDVMVRSFFNTCLIAPSPNNYPLLVESRTLLLELRLILTFICLDDVMVRSQAFFVVCLFFLVTTLHFHFQP